jgi:hypothetical protein
MKPFLAPALAVALVVAIRGNPSDGAGTAGATPLALPACPDTSHVLQGPGVRGASAAAVAPRPTPDFVKANLAYRQAYVESMTLIGGKP